MSTLQTQLPQYGGSQGLKTTLIREGERVHCYALLSRKLRQCPLSVRRGIPKAGACILAA